MAHTVASLKIERYHWPTHSHQLNYKSRRRYILKPISFFILKPFHLKNLLISPGSIKNIDNIIKPSIGVYKSHATKTARPPTNSPGEKGDGVLPPPPAVQVGDHREAPLMRHGSECGDYV